MAASCYDAQHTQFQIAILYYIELNLINDGFYKYPNCKLFGRTDSAIICPGCYCMTYKESTDPAIICPGCYCMTYKESTDDSQTTWVCLVFSL